MSLADVIPGLERHQSSGGPAVFDLDEAGRALRPVLAEMDVCPAGFADWICGGTAMEGLLGVWRSIVAAELAKDMRVFRRECMSLQGLFRLELQRFADRGAGVQHGLF